MNDPPEPSSDPGGDPEKAAKPVDDLHLPGLLGVVAAVGTREAAIQLAIRFGGTNVYIPRQPRDHHNFVKVVGVQIARKVVAVTGPGVRACPMGPLSRRAGDFASVRSMVQAGVGSTEIARRLRIPLRTVYRYRERIEGSAPQ